MKILLYFFARYLLAPLFVAVMIFVLTGIKTIKSKLSLKKLIIFILPLPLLYPACSVS